MTDRSTWNAQWGTIPDLGQGAIVNGIAEAGDLLVFMGTTHGHGRAWTVKGTALE